MPPESASTAITPYVAPAAAADDVAAVFLTTRTITITMAATPITENTVITAIFQDSISLPEESEEELDEGVGAT